MKNLASCVVVSLSLVACGGDDTPKAPASAQNSTASFADLKADITAPAPGAAFAKMYGNYRVVDCKNTGRDTSDMNFCSFSLVAVYSSKNEPGYTILSFRKHPDANSVQFAETFFEKPRRPVETPSFTNAYRETDDTWASSIVSSDSEMQHLRQITAISRTGGGGLYTLEWVDSVRSEPAGKDDHDYGVSLTLERL
jgi:hypothetical protein